MNSKELIKKILHEKPKTKEGWLSLKKQIADFLKSDATEEEKKELSRYTEMVLMACNAYENMK